MKRLLTAVAWGCQFLIASCVAETEAPAFTVVDSAGVSIRATVASDPPQELPWRLADTPLVHIGAVAGDVETQLYRVTGALRLPDGRIVVLNNGSKEVRFFSPTGTHLRTVGGDGDGPGEYRTLQGIALTGDSLLVFDYRLGRLTTLDLEGNFVTSLRLDATESPVHPLRLYQLAGTTSDDGLMLLPRAYPSDMKPVSMRYWDSVPNLSYGRSGTLRDTIGEFAGMDMYMDADAAPPTSGGVYFGRHTSGDLHGDELYLTDGGKYDVRVYGLTGELRRIIRLDRDRRRVSDTDERDLREAFLARAGDDRGSRSRMERTLRGWPRAEFKPWISSVVVDQTGHLWVEEYQPLWLREPRTWSVFAPEGQWLGTTESPAGLTVMEIGDDYVLGVWRDEDGVEHVQVRELVKD